MGDEQGAACIWPVQRLTARHLRPCAPFRHRRDPGVTQQSISQACTETPLTDTPSNNLSPRKTPRHVLVSQGVHVKMQGAAVGGSHMERCIVGRKCVLHPGICASDGDELAGFARGSMYGREWSGIQIRVR